MKFNIYLSIYLLLFILASHLSSNAQNADNKPYNFTIKPFVSSVSSIDEAYKSTLFGDMDARKVNFGFDLNYKLSEKYDIGIYTAYSKTFQFEKYSIINANTFYYGINAEIHLIPLFSGISNSRIDIYTILKLGLVSKFWHPLPKPGAMDSFEWVSKTGFEMGLGVGVSYMITRKFGVFAEYNIGKYFNEDNTRYRAGLKIKL